MLPLSNAKAIKRMHASFLHSAKLSLTEAISPGKNVDATDENGATPLHYAARKMTRKQRSGWFGMAPMLMQKTMMDGQFCTML